MTSARAGRWGKGVRRGPKGRIGDTRARVLAAVADGPVTTLQVAARTGYTKDWAGQILAALHRDGLIARRSQRQPTGRGRRYVWTVPPEGPR